MEVVKAFNNELSAMYECKPPISKAKMSQVTKAAIRGIKFYKHIVQSVEKFIQKCRPEYKIPGLYVIDSIVRQSRHQFGVDKDVFVPRFSKNMHITFQHLIRCPENDKPRIIKVLNLWQKNGVFAVETIQPLLDKANPDDATGVEEGASPPKQKDDPFWDSWQSSGHQSEKLAPNSGAAIPQSTKRKDDDPPMLDSALISQLQELTNQLLSSDSKPKEESVKFNKKLLDFDYGEDEEEDDEKEENGHAPTEPTALALSMAQNLLSNPELLRQLQQMQQTIQQTEALTKVENEPQEEPPKPNNVMQGEQHYFNQVMPPEPAMPPQQVYCPSPPTFVTPQQLPPLHEVLLPPPMIDPPIMCTDMQMDYGMIPDPQQQMQHVPPHTDTSMIYHDHDERQVWAHLKDEDEREHIIRKEKSRSRSRSPRSSSRSTRKHTRRSRSRSPPRRGRRSRSRSPGRYNRRDKRSGNGSSHDWEREQERERERERERDRRRKGLPSLKKNFLAVCSTTLWLGHVPKVIAETDISEVFAEFGSVASIDVIPPRGCAYVCMKQRQDASRALQKLRNLKLQGSNIKMAWAPGKGVKGKEYKDFWDVDQGTTYIPHDKVPEDINLEALEEGGMIDEDSMPSNLKEKRHKKEEEKRAKEEATLKEQQQKTASLLPQQAVAASVPPIVPQMASQFGMATVPGMVGTQPIIMPQMTLPVGVPPPNTMMMMHPHTSQPLLNTQSLMTPMVTSIQGACLSANLQGAMSASLPISLPSSLPTSLATIMTTSMMTTSLPGTLPTSLPATHLGNMQRPANSENKNKDTGDKTPTEEDGSKNESANTVNGSNNINSSVSKPTPFVPSGPTMQAMAFPPPGFQPFNTRLPLTSHMQPNQGIAAMSPTTPWGSAPFPRPQGIGAPPFSSGQLGVIPGMPPQLPGGIPSRMPLFPSALHRPSLVSQGPLNSTTQVENKPGVSSESKSELGIQGERISRFGPPSSISQGRLSPRLNQDVSPLGMGMHRRILGGVNAIPLPQEMPFRSPHPVNFPPQHGGRGAPFAFGMRQQGPFMMRGGLRGPRPNLDFRGSGPNFRDAPFEPEWGRSREFRPPDRDDEPYYGREEFEDWEEPPIDGPLPGGRDREIMPEKLYGESGWQRDDPYNRRDEDERRFRSRESRFDDRRRGGGYRERERSRFDDCRGERNGGRDWSRRDRDRERDRDRDHGRSRDRDRSDSWNDRERDRDSSYGRRDRRSSEREDDKQKTKTELVPKQDAKEDKTDRNSPPDIEIIELPDTDEPQLSEQVNASVTEEVTMAPPPPKFSMKIEPPSSKFVKMEPPSPKVVKVELPKIVRVDAPSPKVMKLEQTEANNEPAPVFTEQVEPREVEAKSEPVPIENASS